MTAQYVKWLAVLWGLLVVVVSCSDDDKSVGPTPADTALYIDEQILLDTTAAIPATAEEIDRLIFDVDTVSMFANGEFDDICVSYGEGDGVDKAIVIFNFDRQGWDTLVSDPGFMIGLMPDIFGHMVSKTEQPISDFINDSLHFYLRPWYLSFPGFEKNAPPPYHYIKGVQLNDHYSPLYIPNSDHVHFTGITYDGQDYRLLARSEYAWKIWQLSPTGELVGQVDCPATYPNDMALGDSSLWITDADYGSPDSTSWIWRTDYSGVVYFQFSFPNSSIGGIAYGDGFLWLSENTRYNHQIFQIDANASCSTGVAVVLDTLDIGKPIKSLTWDGTNLLAASDSLYVISTDGNILDAYTWTVGGDQRISYYDGYLHVYCAGPAGLQLDDRVIVKLKMR